MERNVDETFHGKIDKDPTNFQHWVEWGSALGSQKRYDQAILRFQEAIKINPNASEAYFLWGMILQTQKHNYDEAIEKFEAAIRANPDFFLAKLALVIVLKLAIQVEGETKYKAKLEGLEAISNDVKEEFEHQVKNRGDEDNPNNISVIDVNPQQIDQEQEVIYDEQALSEYYEFLQQGFNSVIVCAFQGHLKRYKEKGSEALTFASGWLQAVLPIGIIRVMIETCTTKVNNDVIAKLDEKFQKFRRHFISTEEASQVIEKVARAMTLHRKKTLLNDFNLAVNDDSAEKVKNVKEFLGKDDLCSKSEEYAFVDLGNILTKCFLEDFTVNPYKTGKERRQNIAAAIIEKMFKYDREKNQDAQETDFQDEKNGGLTSAGGGKSGCCGAGSCNIF